MHNINHNNSNDNSNNDSNNTCNNNNNDNNNKDSNIKENDKKEESMLTHRIIELCHYDDNIKYPFMNIIDKDHSILDLPISSSPKGKYTFFSKLYHPACINCTMEKENITKQYENNSNIISPVYFGYIKDNKITKYRARQLSQRFSIDMSCRVLFGAGATIECLINSEVARYLEFKSIDGLYYLGKESKQLWNVPSSKGDIFSSKLLGALEKRSLMKFLQFALDWGRENMGTDVTTLNEQELAQGRSLHRPQNKDKILSGLDPVDYRNKLFKEFMLDFKISEHLQNIIIHAMCLCSSDDYENISTHDALTRLFAHINSLGRYGATAFLYPLYGCGELSQGFCRMCAVWGGTCILKRKTDRLITSSPTTNIEELIVTSIVDNEGRIFECDAFICGSEQWPNLPGALSIMITRSSVFDDKCLLPTGRSMLVIPPMTNGIDNKEVIFVIQIDAEAMVVPDGACIIHILTESVINENIKSKKDWDEYILNNSAKFDAINTEMDLVMKMLLDTKSSKELFYTTTVRPKFKERSGLLDYTNVPMNVAICEDDISNDIHCDNIINQAKKIFHRLFPVDEFLPLPENPQLDDGGENDMESEMMKATLSSIEK